VCQIRVLVIGSHSSRNEEMLDRITGELVARGKVDVVGRTISPYTDDSIDPNEHDLAVVDEATISKGCSRFVLGSGLPIIAFGDLSRRGDVLSAVVDDAVRMGRLRDYIEAVTGRIEETRQMIAGSS